jgi:hypothetical protein
VDARAHRRDPIGERDRERAVVVGLVRKPEHEVDVGPEARTAASRSSTAARFTRASGEPYDSDVGDT